MQNGLIAVATIEEKPQPKTEQPPAAKKVVTVAERLKQIHEFGLLCEKRKKLTETYDDLEQFEKEMDNEKDRLTLFASGGNEVMIRKPDMVARCFNLIKTETRKAIEETETQILNCNF